MARIIYREDFAGQRELFTAIKLKHDNDGPASVLIAMLAQKGIDLISDATAGTNAAGHETTRALMRRQAENFFELRDSKFPKVFSSLRKQAQNMKSFYSPNVHELGNWGITVNGKKLVYPTDFASKAQVFKDFKAKHDGLAGTSPLLPYLAQHSIDLTVNLAIVTQAETYEASGNTANQLAEDEKQDRDNLWNPVDEHCHQIGTYLKSFYHDNAKQLGYWGFTVDDSPRPPKFRLSSVKPASTITSTGIVIGSTFTNVGEAVLHVYRGKTTTGTPAIVHPGEMLGMTKGYSVITVVNPSATQIGRFKVLVNR